MPYKDMHNPGSPRVLIKDTKEKAFQRAIFYGGASELGVNDSVMWIDYELPVDYSEKKCGRLDLIGKDGNGRFVLCEVKFKGSSNRGCGCPSDACKQIDGYYRTMREQSMYFKFHKNAILKNLDSTFASNKVRLVVIANDAYWRYWRERGALPCNHTTLPNVECYSVAVGENVFENQKGTADSYKPYPPEGISFWCKVTDLYRT